MAKAVHLGLFGFAFGGGFQLFRGVDEFVRNKRGPAIPLDLFEAAPMPAPATTPATHLSLVNAERPSLATRFSRFWLEPLRPEGAPSFKPGAMMRLAFGTEALAATEQAAQRLAAAEALGGKVVAETAGHPMALRQQVGFSRALLQSSVLAMRSGASTGGLLALATALAGTINYLKYGREKADLIFDWQKDPSGVAGGLSLYAYLSLGRREARLPRALVSALLGGGFLWVMNKTGAGQDQ